MSEPTNTPIAEDLKPCPFCGKNEDGFGDATSVSSFYSRSSFAVRCASCSAEGPKEYTENTARAAWNTRASAAEAERDKYKENLHDAEGRYLACYNELTKVQAERDALTAQVAQLRGALGTVLDYVSPPWAAYYIGSAALVATRPKETPCEK